MSDSIKAAVTVTVTTLPASARANAYRVFGAPFGPYPMGYAKK